MSEKCVWLNCVNWLESCGVLSPQQASTIDGIQQLASFIRDGVLLCHLANKLRPCAIDFRNFSQKPKDSQFLCKKNIEAFLLAARNVFGLKEKDLFTQKEILEMTNFGKVLVTLSKLSKLEMAEKQGIRPFSIEVDAVYVIMEEKIEDEIYSVSSHYDTKLGVLDEFEEIYDSLLYKNSSKTSAGTKCLSDRCVDELLSTEKNYISVLNDIIKKFLDPLRELISANQIQTIFFNLEDIFRLHNDFYEELCLARKESHEKLASCFVNNKMKMTIYGDYCAHLPTAVQEVPIVCKSNPAANELIDAAWQEVGVKLHDMILMPFQRFFKYALLLKEIIKKLTTEGKDIEIIEKYREALASVEDLGLYINELTGGKEALLEIDTIMKSFDGGLRKGANTELKDYGRRLFDGEFSYKSPNSRDYDVRHLFLFEKLVLLCKPVRNNLLKYLEYIVVKNSSVSIERVDKEMQLWLTNDKLVHRFKATKEDKLYKLEEFLHLALENIDPAGATENGHCFILTNFDGPHQCYVCKNLLRGAISQGYKCQITNKVVHKECISLATNSVSYRQGDILIAISNYNGIPKFGHNATLTFSKGDRIELVRPGNGLWLQGKRNGRIGYLPLSKIKLLNRPKPNQGYEEHEIDFKKKPVPLPPAPKIDLNSYSWYVGCSEADEASLFDKLLDGTYLVRQGIKDSNHTIVLKYLKVRKLKINQGDKGYYLSKPDLRFFSSIVELIEFYQVNSLSEIFAHIQSTLKYPYKERDSLLTCIATFDFSATQPNQLSFQKGDVIEVTQKFGHVWWQGTLRNESGFFPKNYVELLK